MFTDHKAKFPHLQNLLEQSAELSTALGFTFVGEDDSKRYTGVMLRKLIEAFDKELFKVLVRTEDWIADVRHLVSEGISVSVSHMAGSQAKLSLYTILFPTGCALVGHAMQTGGRQFIVRQNGSTVLKHLVNHDPESSFPQGEVGSNRSYTPNGSLKQACRELIATRADSSVGLQKSSAAYFSRYGVLLFTESQVKFLRTLVISKIDPCLLYSYDEVRGMTGLSRTVVDACLKPFACLRLLNEKAGRYQFNIMAAKEVVKALENIDYLGSGTKKQFELYEELERIHVDQSDNDTFTKLTVPEPFARSTSLRSAALFEVRRYGDERHLTITTQGHTFLYTWIHINRILESFCTVNETCSTN